MPEIVRFCGILSAIVYGDSLMRYSHSAIRYGIRPFMTPCNMTHTEASTPQTNNKQLLISFSDILCNANCNMQT